MRPWSGPLAAHPLASSSGAVLAQSADDFVAAGDGKCVDAPNAGLGAIDSSTCAKDIAAAFMDDPGASDGSSCANLVPRFVRPNVPLGGS
jgi:hypothetical protein